MRWILIKEALNRMGYVIDQRVENQYAHEQKCGDVPLPWPIPLRVRPARKRPTEARISGDEMSQAAWIPPDYQSTSTRFLAPCSGKIRRDELQSNGRLADRSHGHIQPLPYNRVVAPELAVAPIQGYATQNCQDGVCAYRRGGSEYEVNEYLISRNQ